ncbi:MAG: hypothetical protein IMW91_08585 [Firmicutes bacterium]|nr:hypothetical protein [Bacillota bacterium]
MSRRGSEIGAFIAGIVTLVALWQLLQLINIEPPFPHAATVAARVCRWLAFCMWVAAVLYPRWMHRAAVVAHSVEVGSAIAFLVADGGLLFLLQVQLSLEGVAVGPFFSGAFLLNTSFGRHWLFRLAIVLIGLVLSLRRHPTVLFPLLLLSIDLAATGHPGSGSHPLLPVFIDVVHQWSYATWAGGVFFLACIDRVMQLRQGQEIELAVIRRFSAGVRWSVLLLAISGFAAGYEMIRADFHFLQFDYGRDLLGKGLFFLLALLAAASHLLYTERRNQLHPGALFGRALRFEAIALLLAFVVAGALVDRNPPDPTAEEPAFFLGMILQQPGFAGWAVLEVMGWCAVALLPGRRAGPGA